MICTVLTLFVNQHITILVIMCCHLKSYVSNRLIVLLFVNIVILFIKVCRLLDFNPRSYINIYKYIYIHFHKDTQPYIYPYENVYYILYINININNMSTKSCSLYRLTWYVESAYVST